MRKYVSIAKSRAGETAEKQAETPNPDTSVTPTAKTTKNGGKSASKTEED